MFEKLFGTPVVEKILFFTLVNEVCYGAELAKGLGIPVYSVQKALNRLEDSALFVSKRVGKTVLFQFNPRYPFRKEFQSLLKKAYSSLPQELKEELYEPIVRTRPRTRGKPLIRKENMNE